MIDLIVELENSFQIHLSEAFLIAGIDRPCWFIKTAWFGQALDIHHLGIPNLLA